MLCNNLEIWQTYVISNATPHDFNMVKNIYLVTNCATWNIFYYKALLTTFNVTSSVQSVHHWHAHMPSCVWWSPWRPCWSAPVACRPILTVRRLSAWRSSLASTAVCDTFSAWPPPTRDSRGGLDLGNSVATGLSQWSQDSLRAATLAWHVPCVLEHRPAGKWTCLASTGCSPRWAVEAVDQGNTERQLSPFRRRSGADLYTKQTPADTIMCFANFFPSITQP